MDQGGGMRSAFTFLALAFAFVLGCSKARDVGCALTPHPAPEGSGAVISIGPGEGLAAARDRVRDWRAVHPTGLVEVVLSSGRYELRQPLELGPEDADVIWRAADGADVRIAGGKMVPGTGCPVTNHSIRSLLPLSAQAHVREWDLANLGLAEIGDRRFNYDDDIQRLAFENYSQHEAILDSFPPPTNDLAVGVLEMFADDVPLSIARGPKNGELFIDRAFGPTDLRHPNPRKHRMKEAYFSYCGDYPKRWEPEPDPWLCGTWACDWGEQTQQVMEHDVEKRTFRLSRPWHYNGYHDGYRFVGVNMLSELDDRNQYVVDGKAKKVYAWVRSDAKVEFSVAPSLVCIRGGRGISFRRLTFETSRNTAIRVEDATNVVLEACTVRNCGGYGLAVIRGSCCGARGCDLYGLGQGGVFLYDGNRKTLVRSGHFAENCHIHDVGRVRRMYRPAVFSMGVGQRVLHNLIHDTPHSAIQFYGNELEIAWNEIHDCCYASNDAGVLYTGRSWTLRGNRIHHNYIHHVIGRDGQPCKGVYLDDSSGGCDISDNLFEQMSWAVFLGGARDALVRNNAFVDCVAGVVYDVRGLEWQRPHIDNVRLSEWKKSRTMSGIPVLEEPYRSVYPELARIVDNPYEPEGTLITSNYFWKGSGEFLRQYGKCEKRVDDWHYDFTSSVKTTRPYWDSQFVGNYVDVNPYASGWQSPRPKAGLENDGSWRTWPPAHPLRRLPDFRSPKLMPREKKDDLGMAQLVLHRGEKSVVNRRLQAERRPDGAFRVRVCRKDIPEWVTAFDVYTEAASRSKSANSWYMLTDGRWGRMDREQGSVIIKDAYDNYDRTGLFGMKLADGTAWCGIIKGMRHESRTNVEVKNGTYCLYTRFDLKEIGFGLYEDVVIDFYRLNGKDANYSGMGRLYRKYLLDERGCRPLRDRIINNPALAYEAESMFVRYKFGRCDRTKSGPDDWLKSMPPVVVDHTFADYCDFLRRCKAAGMDKLSHCMVGFQKGGHDGPFPDLFPADKLFGGEKGMRKAIALGKRLGYRMSVHINQNNFYLNARRYSAYDVAKTEDGHPYTYTVYPGGQVYHSCYEQVWRNYMDKDLSDMKDLGLNGLLHVDVTTARMPDPCWDPNHRNNRRQMRDWQVACAKKAQMAFGGFSGESGFDHIAEVTDNVLYVTPYPGWQSFKNEMVDGIFPVWQVAFNGIVLSNPFYATIDAPYPRRGAGKTDAVGKNEAVTLYLETPKNRVLKVFELGGRPMFYYADYTDLAPMKRMYDAWQPLKHLQFEFIHEHKELSPQVFATCYENGEELVTNYSARPFAYRGCTVAAGSNRLYVKEDRR